MKDLKKYFEMVSNHVKNIMTIYIQQNDINSLGNMKFDCVVSEESQSNMNDCVFCDLCYQLLVESEEIQAWRDLSYFNENDHAYFLIGYEKKLAYILDKKERPYTFDRLCEDCSSTIDSLFEMKKQAQKLAK